MRLILYQRDDCHLCDFALGLLAEVRAPEFESVFIDGDAELEARYGDRVPVLRATSGHELRWHRPDGFLHLARHWLYIRQ